MTKSAAPLPVSDPTAQAMTAAPVLMPALVPEPFDYLVPEGTPAGALVEATLQGRKLVGAVWGSASPTQLFDGNAPSVDSLLRSALRREPLAAGVSEASGGQAPLQKEKHFKLKPVSQVLQHISPLPHAYREWLGWISEFTLAPKGAVLSLCGLAHALKQPKRALPPVHYTPNLPALSEGQETVWRQMQQLLVPAAPPVLLDGVTGSGKTEVYFHAIAEALNGGGLASTTREIVVGDSSPTPPNACAAARLAPTRGLLAGTDSPHPFASGSPWEATQETIGTPPSKQVLVLLPEIVLTHQWLARFEECFGVAPVAWHSRMTPAAKARAWQAVARGEPLVVVGARSALFLPFSNLGLIIVDEEHDPSYKQEDGVLYHARDMAVARARFERVPILLVSATPALETLQNVRDGKYKALHLASRYGSAGMPEVQLVDLRNDVPERGDFLSPTVKRRMLETLARGEQALLFLNRRGYAPLLLCRGCGHRFECSDCSAWMVLHTKGGSCRVGASRAAAHASGTKSPSKYTLQCHHCDHREPLPEACPECGAAQQMLVPCGPGVERIAEEVRGMFAATPEDQQPRIAVLSSDETVEAETWEAIQKGEIDIIVGTQMVAKGHDFPRLTFVAVVDADVGLSGADLRAGERTYQLLHQLSGRAGRASLVGNVLVQTYLPEHPVMQALVAQNRDQLMQLEAQERKAGGWPPYGQLAAILLDGVDESKVRRAGQILAQSAPEDARFRVLGPAPAPLSKLRGQYRYRLLVKAAPGIHLQRTLKGWLTGQKFSGVRVKVDVNPYYFL